MLTLFQNTHVLNKFAFLYKQFGNSKVCKFTWSCLFAIIKKELIENTSAD